jgi:hypothetical protein
MKIRFLAALAGADFAHDVGAEVEFPDEEAARLVEAGIAEPATDAAPAKRGRKAAAPAAE